MSEKNKKFIAFAIKMPYIVKVVTLRVTVNKDDKDADYYRWQAVKLLGI